jgi:ubiquinone biosynthesis monooxygenase Coq7
MAEVLGWIDRLIDVADQGLRSVAAETPAQRPSPADSVPDAPLTADEREASARLLRVNRAGEIAAQALYSAQALFARDAATEDQLRRAASEEHDHLAWCTARLRELGGQPSRLDPLWYLGSSAIGALAGLAGDRVSLGFVAETERQVEAHLEDHLSRLPAGDAKSRAILEQMAADELRHGSEAGAAGAPIREPVRSFMHLGGEILRRVALRL